MPGHYDAIKAQLTQDVGDSLGDGGRVVYGRVLKPLKEGVATASIFTSVSRVGSGRQVKETYEFRVFLLAKPPAATDLTTDVEAYLMGIANDLIMRLAPFTTDGTVPASPGPYAGVGALRRVSQVKPVDRDDADQHAGIELTFSCLATVHQ